MRKIAALIVVSMLAGAALASAATGWRTFASAADSGEYGVYVNASADVVAPKALAVRPSGLADVSWTLICTGGRDAAPAGTMVLVNVASAKKCSLSGSASNDTGRLQLELLRR